MTVTCIPSTCFRLLLLSVIAGVTCIQPGATAASAEGMSLQVSKDTPTPIASRFKSSNEERLMPIGGAEETLTHSIDKTVSPSLLEKLGSVWEGGKTAASSLVKKVAAGVKLRSASNKADIVSNLFHEYKVNDVTTKVFESSQYRRWSGFILNVYADAPLEAHKLILAQLVVHYKYKLFEFLADAKQVKGTQEISEKYESMLIDTWISESVAKKTDLLQHPYLLEWFKQTPEVAKKSAAIELRLRLQEHKVADWNSIVARAVTEEGATSNILQQLKAVRPYEVEFRRLGLHSAVSVKALLESTNFEKWKAFVTTAKEDFGRVLLSTLRERTVSDRQLLDDLLALEKSAESNRLTVQKALFNEWNDRGYGVAKVLNLLELDGADSQVFRSPVREVLTAYLLQRKLDDKDVSVLITTWIRNSKENGDNLLQRRWIQNWYMAKTGDEQDAATEHLLVTLQKITDGKGLASMLRSAEAEGDTALLIAGDLRILSWKKNRLSATDAFKELKGETTKELVTNPILTTLHKYVNDDKVFYKLLVNKLPEGVGPRGLLKACIESDKSSWLTYLVKRSLRSQ